jgi:hypothetical protein
MEYESDFTWDFKSFVRKVYGGRLADLRENRFPSDPAAVLAECEGKILWGISKN